MNEEQPLPGTAFALSLCTLPMAVRFLATFFLLSGCAGSAVLLQENPGRRHRAGAGRYLTGAGVIAASWWLSRP